jgi:hypothetical protein
MEARDFGVGAPSPCGVGKRPSRAPWGVLTLDLVH